MAEIQSLELFLNKKSGNFLLLNYAINPRNKFRVGWGNLRTIFSPEMQSEGLDLVLSNLAGFSTRDGSEMCELDRMTPPERRRFNSTHKAISVSLPTPDVLVLQGSSKVGASGRVGTSAQRVEVRLPSTQQEFYAAMRQAFDLSE